VRKILTGCVCDTCQEYEVNNYKTVAEHSERKRLLGRHGRRWNVTLRHKEAGCDAVVRIHSAHYREEC